MTGLRGWLRSTLASGLVTQRLTDLTTHTEFDLPGKGSAETHPRICVRVQRTDSEQIDVSTAKGRREHTAGRKVAHRPSTRARHFLFKASVVYRVYDGHPAIRKWLVLKNTGSDSVAYLPSEYRSHRASVGPFQRDGSECPVRRRSERDFLHGPVGGCRTVCLQRAHRRRLCDSSAKFPGI